LKYIFSLLSNLVLYTGDPLHFGGFFIAKKLFQYYSLLIMSNENGVPANMTTEPVSRGAASVKLPTFWAATPAGWFRSVEAQFAVKGITSGVDKYFLVLAALSEMQVDKVMSVTEEEPTEESYGRLKVALVASHTLTPFQQVDRLVNMEGLGGRKPSELLTAMDKLKPKDPNSFYAYHFLQRMPHEVRILLAHDDLQDMRALAEKADQLMALHQPQSHDAIAAVQATEPHGEPATDSDGIAAVSSKRRKNRKQRDGRQGRQRDSSLSQSIVEQSPLCWAHIRYGDKAYSCTKPCAWLEN
jgi:hypothetical protein